MQYVKINENGINIVFGITKKNQIIEEAFQLVQVNLSGYNRPYEKHGNKHIVTAPGEWWDSVGELHL